jgi:tetratricopeptide (TPR) repeat protein
MTTPQAASPNANYAMSGLSSRTAEPSGTGDTSVEINDILARRLWQNRILAPDPNEDAETRNALRRLIQQVHSVTFDDHATEPTFSAPLEPTGKTDGTAAETTAAVPPGQKQGLMPAPLPSGPSRTPLPAETLTQLEDLLADPTQVSDPLEMAELLFLSGRATRAAVFYEKALAQIPANDLARGGDRAWILFQLGNCLRETNQTKAKDTYMKLIAQYPNSPWTELAKAHGRLISWYQSANPQRLLAPTE